MKVHVVVGANYGDEGKGLLTEHLCRLSSKPLVILANGGCQRGHTVDNPEFGRHVFQHFGSGTFVGAGTYFAAEYRLNPMQFVKEHEELVKMLGKTPFPAIRANKSCIFQLPVDIFLNRFTETIRGKDRHGSVGAGIWETCLRRDFLRRDTFQTAISFYEFMSRYTSTSSLISQLKYLSEEYFDYRMNMLANGEFKNMSEKELRTLAENDPLYPIMFSNGMYEHFAEDCKKMFKSIDWIEYFELPDVCDTCIFEQGQGLCLDQEYCEDARYATPSSPGLASVAPILLHSVVAEQLEYISIDYVTRSYLTRHGAGPFPEEDKKLRFPDKTNIPNDWQGTLRFGKFDSDATYAMLNRINRDLALFKSMTMTRINAGKVPLHPTLTVTHCNEIPPNKTFKMFATQFSYEDDSRNMIPNALWNNSLVDDNLFRYKVP